MSGKGQSKVVEMLKKTSGLVQLVINRESKNVPEVQESEEAMVRLFSLNYLSGFFHCYAENQRCIKNFRNLGT